MKQRVVGHERATTMRDLARRAASSNRELGALDDPDPDEDPPPVLAPA